MPSGNDTTGITRRKRFVLIFDDLRSVHLFKDVGQIPFQLHRHFGYDVEIVCRRNEQHYLYVDDVLKGLKLTFYEGSPYRYLWQHARGIDVLMLLHISTRTIRRGLLYKLLNPAGCLYIKTDMSGDRIRYAQWGERNFLTQAKRVFLFNRLVSKVDIVSFETRAAYQGVDTIPAGKKLLMPNGFDPAFIDWYGIQCRTFDEKENIILLVGRHGDYAKNTELMLDALEVMSDIGHWRVWFVGPMTGEFEKRKNIFLKQNPQLAGKVVFPGQIDDKRELFELYSRAKLLCLTSRWESWGMVCVEAMAFGCVPVMTPVSSADDLSGNGCSGVVINSYEARDWAAGLRELNDSPARLAQLSLAAVEHFQCSFNWQKIVSRLDERVNCLRG